jgi:F-type H+-transporting ATPase subunit b
MTAAFAQETVQPTIPPEGTAGSGPLDAHSEVPGEHETPFPPFNPEFYASQIFWLVLTFVALYLLMRRVALPRIAGILEDRRDRIASDLDHAQRLKEQSDLAIASYEQALAEARLRAMAIAGTAGDQARQQTEAQRTETEKRLAQDLAVAERRIADIKEKAISDVGEIATEAAEAVVEALLGKPVGRSEISGAVTAVMGK